MRLWIKTSYVVLAQNTGLPLDGTDVGIFLNGNGRWNPESSCWPSHKWKTSTVKHKRLPLSGVIPLEAGILYVLFTFLYNCITCIISFNGQEVN